MFCKNCGKEIHDEAVMCVHCGAETTNKIPADILSTGNVQCDEPAYGGLIALSILIPLFGIIYGTIFMSMGKKQAGKVYLWSSIITWAICILISVLAVTK